MELDPKTTKKILFFIAFGAVCFAAVTNFEKVISVLGGAISVFRPVITALCIAFVLNVLLSALENKAFAFMDKSKRGFVKKAKRPLCLTLTYLIALGLIVLLISVIIPDVIDTCVNLAEKNIEIDWTKAANAIKDYLVNYSDRIFGSAYSFTTSVFSGIYNTVFSVMISVYILACKEKIGRFTVKCIDVFAPKKAAAAVYHVSSLTYGCFAKFIGGQLTESVILGVLCFIGMTVFRFPNATVISVFICATSLIPIVGATLGVIVGFLLIFISSPVKALLFIVFFVVLQQLEGSLIYPRVVGKSVGLPGVIVVCAVLVGGNIGGILKEAVERRTPKENTENE